MRIDMDDAIAFNGNRARRAETRRQKGDEKRCEKRKRPVPAMTDPERNFSNAW